MLSIEMMQNIMEILKITSMCLSVKTRSCLLKNTERTRKHSLPTKLTCAELVKMRALFAGIGYLRVG